MKVLLVDPPQLFLEGSGGTRQVQPLGMAYVGAALASDCDVRFLLPDTRAYTGDDPWGEIERVIRAEAPDVLGLTAVTATWPAARRVAALAKSIDSAMVTVLGGVHASTLPAQALHGAPGVDYVVQGEGEETMRELVDVLRAKRASRAVEAIAGLWWRDRDGTPKTAGPRAPIRDLDALPFPRRTGLVWPEDVHPAFYQALITLRGCPYQCIYCAVPNSEGKQTRYRSAANVVDEIALLREQHDVPCLFFHDSVFSLHRKRTVAICEEMLARGLTVPFHCQTRADRVDAELLALMKRAGCEQIFFGIESGDAESLARIKKKVPLDQVREAVRMVKDLGIRCTGFFMVGFPWETPEVMERTADFATDLELDAVSLFSATPLPGTELWEMAGGERMPDSIDFRTPQVNLTALPDEQYATLYGQIKARIDAYNLSRMLMQAERAMQGAPGPAQISWIEAIRRDAAKTQSL